MATFGINDCQRETLFVTPVVLPAAATAAAAEPPLPAAVGTCCVGVFGTAGGATVDGAAVDARVDVAEGDAVDDVATGSARWQHTIPVLRVSQNDDA